MLSQRSIVLSAALLAMTLLNGVIAATAGCGKTPTLRAGTQTMTVNGKSRQWILTLPQNYNNTNPYRLIFGLHWLGGNFQDMVNGATIRPYYGLQQLSNNSAIFVAPNGLNNGWANSGGEDITFVQQMLQTLDADLCINEKLRFSTGFSYGGAMSYSIACTLGKTFRAVGVLSGALLSGCAGGSDPVAYYGQHGVSDSVLNIAQGRQLRDTFIRNNGCTAQNAPEPAKGSRTHIKTVYSGCAADKPVIFNAFDGDHVPTPTDGGSNKDTTFTGTEVWNFFSQFK